MLERKTKWLADHVVGALAVYGVAALSGSLIGAWSSLEPPWNYTVASGVAALVLAAALWHGKRHGRQLPPPWGASYKPGSKRGDSVTVTDSISITTHGVARTDRGRFSIVRFDLLGTMDQHVPTGRRPTAVEFLEPTHRVVKPPLPEAVRWRFRTIAVVKEFTHDGVILDSHVQGISARVQVYHDEEDTL
jgi:hypothetical protein